MLCKGHIEGKRLLKNCNDQAVCAVLKYSYSCVYFGGMDRGHGAALAKVLARKFADSLVLYLTT
jgi:hypothetical protein